MCVEARYLIQYIHFSFRRFCDDKSSRGIATVFNYRPATYTMFKVIMQKHIIHDTLFWEV